MKEGKTQETAAAAAGMSLRSARKWQSGAMPSEAKKRRHWPPELNALIASLSSAGTINQAGNPVDWTSLINVPAGLADGAVAARRAGTGAATARTAHRRARP